MHTRGGHFYVFATRRRCCDLLIGITQSHQLWDSLAVAGLHLLTEVYVFLSARQLFSQRAGETSQANAEDTHLLVMII